MTDAGAVVMSELERSRLLAMRQLLGLASAPPPPLFERWLLVVLLGATAAVVWEMTH